MTEDDHWVGTGDVGLGGHYNTFAFHDELNGKLLESFEQSNNIQAYF